MRTKDKNKSNIVIIVKKIIIFLAFLIIILSSAVFYNYYFAKNEVYAKETNDEIININNFRISNADEIDLDKVIENNTKKQKKEEYILEEIELEYITKYQSNVDLPKGLIQVIQEGREGIQQVTKKRVYENSQLVTEEIVGSKVTKAAVNKIVEVGTGKYSSNYKVKKGDTIYIISDRASIMVEPYEESQKIATLTKGKEVKVSSIEDTWYKISSIDATGYVKKENTTYINPNIEYEEENFNVNSANIQKLSLGMALNKPSGLSLEQFRKVLSDTKDVNKIFYNNAQYFYYIEQQYNINGIFVASVGIHESAWGTSKISKNKYNLFGYGAYDSSPYNSAYSFSDYSECIDLIARVFVKYYLNPKGTSIYGGEKAMGTYYNGPTLTGVNTKYATDKNWANAVYTHMKYLYNKL